MTDLCYNANSLSIINKTLILSSKLNPQWGDESARRRLSRTSNSALGKLYLENLKSYSSCQDGTKGEVGKRAGDYYRTAMRDELKLMVRGTFLGHKYPFVIGETELKGRHLVSTRKIQAGEVLLMEGCLFRGVVVRNPKEDPAYCIQCFKEAKTYLCPNCGFFLCRKRCKDVHSHGEECRYLSLLGLTRDQHHIHSMENRDFSKPFFNLSTSDKTEYAETIKNAYLGFIKEQKPRILQYYASIPTFKTLLEISKSENKHRVFSTLQGHVVPNSRRYRINQKHIVDTISKMGLPFDEQFVHRVASVWDTNAFQINFKGSEFQMIFALTSFFNHSCKPNCEGFYTSSGVMVFRAVEDVAPDEELTICYTEPFWPTYLRRDHLYITKDFICGCKRCCDITECGTFMGHVRCADCGAVSVCPNNTRELCKSIKCSNCGVVVNVREYFALEAKFCATASTSCPRTPKEYEEFVREVKELYGDRFHRNNYLMQRVLLNFLMSVTKGQRDVRAEDTMKLASYFRECYSFMDSVLPRLHHLKGLIGRRFMEYSSEVSGRSKGLGKGRPFENERKVNGREVSDALRQ